MIALSDAAIGFAPLLVGMGASAFFTPRPYAQCGVKRGLNPPPYVFAVAWTTLYALQGAAAAVAWRADGRRWSRATAAAALTFAALVAWSLVFFNVCLPRAAFAAIVMGLLPLSIAVAALYAAERRTASAAMSLPLVAWLCVAGYLSFMAIP